MSALGHVWTAPWQELSDAAAALVGCGHVSGLVYAAVKPLAIILCADRVPIESTHSKDVLTHAGSPDPRIDLVCITSSRAEVLEVAGAPNEPPSGGASATRDLFV